jgi:arylsulfatase A-like enzyme
VDTFDPHEPWDAPQWYVQMYDAGYGGQVVDYPLYAPVGFLSEAELRHVRALYAAEVTLVDRWVGRLLEKVRDMALLEDTLVLLTTDHGFLHGEHGIMGKSLIEGRRMDYVPLYEEINHIPLIASLPGADGAVSEALVQPMDLMPTMLELAGVDAPETVQGRSFAGVLRGERDGHREFAVSSPYVGGQPVPATVTMDRWSAVFWPEPEEGEAEVDRAVDGYEKQWAEFTVKEPRLFDLRDDPAQETDLSADRPEVMADLHGRLMDFWGEVGVPEEQISRWRGS